MHQITLFQDKKSKNFLGDAPPPRRLRRLDARAFSARYSAPLASRLRLKDDLCFRLLLGPCGRLSWLPVSFLLHVKYALLYRIV